MVKPQSPVPPLATIQERHNDKIDIQLLQIGICNTGAHALPDLAICTCVYIYISGKSLLPEYNYAL